MYTRFITILLVCAGCIIGIIGLHATKTARAVVDKILGVAVILLGAFLIFLSASRMGS